MSSDSDGGGRHRKEPGRRQRDKSVSMGSGDTVTNTAEHIQESVSSVIVRITLAKWPHDGL